MIVPIRDGFAAEFVIHLAEKQPTFDGFKALLTQNGAEFTVGATQQSDQLTGFHVPLHQMDELLVCVCVRVRAGFPHQ